MAFNHKDLFFLPVLYISFSGAANKYPAFYSQKKAYALDSMISYERES
jgi:cobalamin biosynthesis protein CobD/CbiB